MFLLGFEHEPAPILIPAHLQQIKSSLNIAQGRSISIV